MRILIWNVRDAGRKDFKYQSNLLIQSHEQDILVLIETILNVDKALSIILSLKFPNFKFIPSECFPGGIWLIWDETIIFNIHIISIYKRLFTVKFNYSPSNLW